MIRFDFRGVVMKRIFRIIFIMLMVWGFDLACAADGDVIFSCTGKQDGYSASIKQWQFGITSTAQLKFYKKLSVIVNTDSESNAMVTFNELKFVVYDGDISLTFEVVKDNFIYKGTFNKISGALETSIYSNLKDKDFGGSAFGTFECKRATSLL